MALERLGSPAGHAMLMHQTSAEVLVMAMDQYKTISSELIKLLDSAVLPPELLQAAKPDPLTDPALGANINITA